MPESDGCVNLADERPVPGHDALGVNVGVVLVLDDSIRNGRHMPRPFDHEAAL